MPAVGGRAMSAVPAGRLFTAAAGAGYRQQF
jgi:hypothetical protein